jgi:dimethylglycine dehydrogenase
MASLDPKRYGGWMTTEYAARKNEECYEHVFILHHPDEEREACRRCAPRLPMTARRRGAQFGQINGWDRPNYYGPVDAPRTSTMTAQLPSRRLVAICRGRGRRPSAKPPA